MCLTVLSPLSSLSLSRFQKLQIIMIMVSASDQSVVFVLRSLVT